MKNSKFDIGYLVALFGLLILTIGFWWWIFPFSVIFYKITPFLIGFIGSASYSFLLYFNENKEEAAEMQIGNTVFMLVFGIIAIIYLLLAILSLIK